MNSPHSRKFLLHFAIPGISARDKIITEAFIF